MAYVDKSFSNATRNGSDMTITTLTGLPTIPSNATLESVWLYFDVYRKDGSILGGEVSVVVNGNTIKVSDVERNTQYTGLSVNLTNYVKNNSGNLSYMNGTTSLDIRGYHNYWLLGPADWTVSNIYIRANYSLPVTYNIAANVNDSNGGSVSGGGTYNSGASVELTATPATGWRVAYWMKDGVRVDNTDNVTKYKTTAAANATYTVVFEKLTYTITAKSNNDSYGTVSGGGSYSYGSSATLKATANTGYKFKQWNDGNTNNPRTVTVTGAATYTATFEKILPPEITSVQMLYSNKQISASNKVPAGEYFRIVVGAVAHDS